VPRFARLAIAAAVTGIAVMTYVPAASAAAPPSVTRLHYRAGETRVALDWRNPTASADFARVHVVYAAGHTPAGLGDGTDVHLSSAKATSALATGLVDGTAYTFVVFTTDAGGNATASQPVTATPHPPARGHFTVALGRRSIGTALGTSSSLLSGTYTDTAGQPVGGLRVRVLRRFGGSTQWVRVATVTSGSAGRVRMLATPKRTAYYRFFLPSSPYDAATYSSAVRLRYWPTISLSAPALARTYTTFAVTGRVRPAMGGQHVALRSYYAGAWHTVARTTTGPAGGYRVRLTPRTTTPRRLRAVYLATPAHQGDRSAIRTVSVVPRDLRSGMRGPDVLALQRRLRSLHYDVGRLDGAFGYDTLHAVVPFQKLNRLSRTGVVDAATLRRLSSPTVPRRRHLVSGHSVEVNIARQVAAFYSDGRLYRIVDVSTGSGRTYVQDGQVHVATTPRGSFRVERKIDGLRIGALGALWRPSYFYLGYAIHGSASVPPYPASHGCVRITNPAVDRYYAWLSIGTRVYVFSS
jgi:hypothetical protein